MSGGVDSSVATALMIERGHEVVGATLKLWGGSSDSGCCSVADVDDARRVAQLLGIDHHVFNYTEEFEDRVVTPFVESYARGASPNPCIDCNRHVKFDLLLDRAQRLGFDAVATGHHARVARRDEGSVLVRGVDEKKDQSYVLGYLRAAQLERLLLPIGEITKDEVREHARRFGLRTWDKPDSQDVCFIESSKGREDFLRRRLTLTPAKVVDARSGEVVGSTEAAELMTVGQRRGVTPGRDGARRFVSEVDLAAGIVRVGELADVLVTSLTLEESSVSFARHPWRDGSTLWAQTSAHGEPRRVTMRRVDDVWRVEFADAVRPVATGQSVVLYDETDPMVVVGAAVVAS